MKKSLGERAQEELPGVDWLYPMDYPDGIQIGDIGEGGSISLYTSKNMSIYVEILEGESLYDAMARVAEYAALAIEGKAGSEDVA